jgi:tetratricopeptide (TPR) repeat protein
MIFRRLLLPIDLCMVVFALSAVIGIFTAYDLTMSTPIGLTIIISVALYFVTAYAVRNWETALGVSIILMMLGMGVALFFITQYSHQNYPETPGFILRMGEVTTFLPNFGITMHPNSAATFVEGFIPIGVILAITTRRMSLRPLWIMLTLVMLYAIFLTYSRGAWVALIATLVLGVLTFSRRAAIITAVVATVGIATLIILGPERLDFLQNALSWTSSRYELYRNSLYVAGDYAITGVGLGDVFALIYSRYGLLIQVPFLTYTHNLPLAVWFGQGILGLTAFIGIVVTFVLFVWYVIRSSAPRRLFVGAWLGVAATLIHGLFDARQYAEAWWIMPVLFVLIGLTAALGRMSLVDAARRSREVDQDFVPLLLPIGTAIVAVVAGVIFLPQIRAMWATNLGALDETRGELAPNLSEAERAELYEDARQNYLAALAIDPNWPNANRRLGNLDVKQSQYAEAVPLLETAHRIEAGNPAAVKGLGLAYTWVGRTDDAARLFETLDNPQSIEEELGSWGGWRTGQGEYDLAAYAYETAAKMTLDAPNTILWLVTANNFRAAERPDEARFWYERILEIEPNNESARNALAEMGAS